MRDQARLDAFIGGASRLPVIPRTTIRLLITIDSADSSASDIAGIIEADPSLSVRLLKLANSSFYGQRGRISTVRDAVVILGSKTIRSLALVVWTHTLQSHVRNTQEMTLMAPLLAHGLAAGVAAGMLAQRINPGLAADAFIAGLLHDIGRVALLAQLGKGYEFSILDPAQRDGLLLHEKEAAILGFDHGALGSALMASWGLPSFLADVAAKHHDSGIVPRNQFFVAAAALADDLATRLRFNVALAIPRPRLDDIAAYFRLQDEDAAAGFLELCAARIKSLNEALE